MALLAETTTGLTREGRPCVRCGLTERYITNKACVSCRRESNAAEYKRRGSTLFAAGLCILCSSPTKPGWARCQECLRKLREGQRKRLYDLTRADYDALICAHEGRCAGCGDPRPDLQIDHCHATGRVRGLLCPPCNAAAGHMHDSPDRALMLVTYLISEGY